MLSHERVKELLFQRDPFLWVDEVTQCEPGKYAVSEKYMDPDLPMFKGYCPSGAEIPAVILVEAMSQTAGIATALFFESMQTKAGIRLFAGIENARFFKKAFPGSTLTFKSVLRDPRARFIYADCETYCDGELIAQATVSFAFKK